MYCVIFGDIIHSKSLDVKTREQDTATLNAILEQINKKYQNIIMASFGIVRGDAFEGVLFSQQDIPSIFQDIIKSCWEERSIKVRLSAVVDDLSSVSSERDKADGPAFHRAIQEIERMRSEKSDHWFQISIVTDTIAQPLIDSLLNLLAALTKEWTEKQREIVWAMSDVSNQQYLVSKKMNIAASVVNKQLKSANYEAYKKAWSGLEKYLIDSEDASINEETKRKSYTTYYSVGQRKNKLGDYDSAVKYLNESIVLATNEFGKNDSRLVPLYNSIAQTYLEIMSDKGTSNKCAQIAKEGAKKAIDAALSCQKNKAILTTDYARTMNIKGNYHLKTHDYGAALDSFNRAIEIIQARYGSKHPLLQDYYNSIAKLYEYSDDFTLALAYYKTSLKIAKRYFEQDPFSYADTLYRIGLIYEIRGMYEEAKAYIEKSLSVLKSILPAKDKKVIEEKAVLERVSRIMSERPSEEKERKNNEY